MDCPDHTHIYNICLFHLRGQFQLQVQAYFPKGPGNFGHHFLWSYHCNTARFGVVLHQEHMERGAHRFFSEKNVGVSRSDFSLEKVHFFAAQRRSDESAAQRRKIYNFTSHLRCFQGNLARFSLTWRQARACLEDGTQRHATRTSMLASMILIKLLASSCPIPHPRCCCRARMSNLCERARR